MLLIIDQKLNYADARIKCSDLGSQLVEFQDEYEYDQVILHYRQVPYTRLNSHKKQYVTVSTSHSIR